MPSRPLHLIHAHPLDMNDFVVLYGCFATYGPGNSLECRWDAYRWANNTITQGAVTGDCA